MAGTTEMRDEAQMIVSIIAGDSQLFHELIRPYERRVYAMALSFLHNEADAEDAAQEAFLKAFRNLSSWTVRSPADCNLATRVRIGPRQHEPAPRPSFHRAERRRRAGNWSIRPR